MKKTLLTATALSAVSTLSMAADLPARGAAVAPAPMFVAAPSWAGAYLGVNMGVIYTDNRSQIGYDRSGDVYTETANSDRGQSGALAGITAGYNFQSGSMVYGIEADWAGVFGSRNKSTYNDYGNAFSTQTRGFGTLRARVGFTNGASLFYLTAGAAAVQQKLGIDGSVYVGDGGKVSSSSKWKIAPVAGVGLEHQLGGGWTAKVEGLYVFDTKRTYISPDFDGYDGKSFRNRSSHAVLRVGVNYIFGSAASSRPVLARY